MDKLEQSGIFRCKPLSWEVQEAQSGAVGINMSFLVIEELDGDKWLSWDEAGEYMFWGTFWVVKKDGTVNQSAVDQLAKSLGWNGDLASVVDSAVGNLPLVQVTVKEEVYEGVTRYKGSWMNPAEYTGGSGGGADPAKVKELKGRFGSLLRAAAASATEGTKKAPEKPVEGKKGGPKGKVAPAAPMSAKAPAKPAQTNEEHAAARKAAGLPDKAITECPDHGPVVDCPTECPNSLPY